MGELTRFQEEFIGNKMLDEINRAQVRAEAAIDEAGCYRAELSRKKAIHDCIKVIVDKYGLDPEKKVCLIDDLLSLEEKEEEEED